MRRFALLLALFAGPAWGEALPVFNPSGPNAEAYGSAEGYRAGYPQTQARLVGNFSHYDSISTTRRVAKAAVPYPLARAAQEISLHYTYKGAVHSLTDYLERQPTTGLLILKDSTILAEHYQYGRTEQDRFLSQSMAKTVVSMLVGIAVSEGKIHTVDELAQSYVPGLVGSEVGATPLRALLHMSSGIAYHEVYDGHDDAAKLNRAIWGRNAAGAVAGIREFNIRESPPDTHWYYKGLDTETVGLVLAGATGKTLSDYLHEKIWSRIGTESDALWAVDAHGQEPAFCCLNITLRDYARLGRLLAFDGNWNGEQVIPKDWVLAATTPQAAFLQPGAEAGYYGYGYQVWLLPGDKRQFVLLGIHGQQIYVDPESKLVLVHTAVRATPTRDPLQPELGALWRGLVRQEGR